MPCHITRSREGCTYCGLVVGSHQWDSVEDAEIQDDAPRSVILDRVTCEHCRTSYIAIHHRAAALDSSFDTNGGVLSWEEMRGRLEALERRVQEQQKCISVLSAALYVQENHGDLSDKDTRTLKPHLEGGHQITPMLTYVDGNWVYQLQGYQPRLSGETVWDKIGSDE